MRFAIALVALSLFGCGESYRVDSEAFGTMPDGRPVSVYTVTTPSGLMMKVTNYGGIVTHLFVPDRTGALDDVVLGYDNMEAYVADSPYFGAIVGRYGNRIAGGGFSIDDHEYTLVLNDGANHLHGGLVGFDKVLWKAAPFIGDDGAGIVLRYTAADGEEGYPGQLEVTVTYKLSDDGDLRIDYEAVTDKATHVNLTHHSYFNLAGPSSDSILDHEVEIAASRITAVAEGLIPTGLLQPVADTPFDFRERTAVGARIGAEHEQIAIGIGYDHNWVLDDTSGGMRFAARVFEPTTGRVMAVQTTEPGIQFYSGNFLNGTLPAKDGGTYDYRSGLCLETQHFPDTPNQPDFPSTVLRPGERYRSSTIYSFSVE